MRKTKIEAADYEERVRLYSGDKRQIKKKAEVARSLSRVRNPPPPPGCVLHTRCCCFTIYLVPGTYLDTIYVYVSKSKLICFMCGTSVNTPVSVIYHIPDKMSESISKSEACLCVLRINPFCLLPVDIRHNQCACRFFDPRELLQ